MPAPGDQHNTIANPFEEAKPRVSEFTAQEIATLQSRLEKQLGPEYLSARTGPSGQKVHYIAAEKCIALANEVFGFNGWSSSIQNIQVDFVDENQQTLKISLGLSVIVRVTLRDGTFHEDIGYGHIENCKGKAAAFEKAKKEGTTDALKRALRNFGNVLGNCIYDKAYLQKVTKMKVEPSKFDESSLHRHSDFLKHEQKTKEAEAAKAEASAALTATLAAAESFEDFLGEFDEVDFNVVEDGHPDEVALLSGQEKPSNQQNNGTSNPVPMQPPSRPLGRSASAGNYPRPPQTPNQAPNRGGFSGPQNQSNQSGPRPQGQQNSSGRPPALQSGPHAGHVPNHNSITHQTPPGAPQQNQGQNSAAGAEPVGFFSAKAVNALVGHKEDAEPQLPQAPQVGQVFNPRAESPSIRKTPGIDHTKSKPVGRNGQHVSPAERAADAGNGTNGVRPMSAASLVASRPPAGPQQPAQRGNVLNPQLDQARRIGAPGGPGSPLANRGQYRPPTMKRPLPSDAAGGGPPGRPALTEVTTNATVNGVGGAAGLDPKRQKIGG